MILKFGDHRPEVEILQRALKERGLYTVKLDQDYGPKTQAGVAEFERREGLPVDGQADETVLVALGLLERPKTDKEDKRSILSVTNLTESDKAAITRVMSVFEGDFGSCNRDGEFEGVFDAPSRDKDGKKIPTSDRKAYATANGLRFDPSGWSKYGTDPGHVGLSYGFIQFTQDGGTLGQLLKAMRAKKPTVFDRTFGAASSELIRVTNLPGVKERVADSTSPSGYARRSPRVVSIGGADLWKEPWLTAFATAGNDPDFQQVQIEQAIGLYFNPMLKKSAKPFGVVSEKGLTILMDRSVQLGPSGCATLLKDHVKKFPPEISEREMFEALYQKVKGRGWAHRLRKLIDSEQVSWFKRFEF